MAAINDQIEKLLKENIALNREVHTMLSRMQRTFWISRAWGILKIAVIVVPLVWGYMALRPYFTQWMKVYGDLLGVPAPSQPQSSAAAPTSGQFKQLEDFAELYKLLR